MSPDGSRLYVTQPEVDRIAVIDTATELLLALIPVPYPISVTVSPDNQRLYVAHIQPDPEAQSSYDALSVIETGTLRRVATVKVGRYTRHMAVSPDSRRVYVVNHFDSSITVLDTSTNQVLKTIPVGQYPEYLTTRDNPDEVAAHYRLLALRMVGA